MIRVLLAHAPSAAEDQTWRVLRAASEISVCGRVSLAEVLPSTAILKPQLVILALDPRETLEPKLIPDLLDQPGVKLLVMWPAHARPVPDALTRGFSLGRMEIIRPPPESALSRRADSWDQALVDTIRAMSEGRWTIQPRPSGPASPTRGGPPPPPRMIGFAASTGGPPAMAKILGDLPASFPVPMLLVQHTLPGFVAGLADWLTRVSPIRVVVARHDTLPEPGYLYIAPDNSNLEIGLRKQLVVRPARNGPSADALLLSLAAVLGAESAGLVLTGMGSDGAQGLLAIRQAGGATFAQNEASSVVFGMPKAAIAAGAVDRVLPLESVSSALRQLVGPASQATSAQSPSRPIDTESQG